MDPAALIRSTRERHGLSQERLALRAGTTQSAISRIERGEEQATWERLRSILLAMGEEPVLSVRARGHDRDPAHLAMERALTPAQRLEGAVSSVEFGNELHAAARRRPR